MFRSSIDPDGRRLLRAAALTGLIYGLASLFLFLSPCRPASVFSRGAADVADSSYRPVRLSLSVAQPASGTSSSTDRSVAPKPFAAPADSVAGPREVEGSVRASGQIVSSKMSAVVVPVADPALANSRAEAVSGNAVYADSTLTADDSDSGPNRAIPAGDGAQGPESSRGDGSVSIAGSPGNTDGYAFSGNGFLPDGVRGSGGFSDWIDGAIRKRLVYPERARRRNVQGAVILALSVPADGSRCEASVLSSSGSPILDAAALSLLRSLFPSPVAPGKAFYSPVKIQYLILQD